MRLNPLYVLPPLAGAEELAMLRAMAELLERCLDGWVHAVAVSS